MAAGAVALWDTCSETSCDGARIRPDGPCLAHATDEELAQHLSQPERKGDIDGRGVVFGRASWGRVLDAFPPDEDGRRQLGIVRLDHARFDHEVSFDEITFFGPVSMVGAAFRADARFGGATFAARADFNDVDFMAQAWFVESSFAAAASFRGARFRGAAFFQRTTFAAAASFDGAVFSASATITGASFREASFRDVVFEGHAYFQDSSCARGWQLEGTRFRREGDGPQLPPEAVPEEPIPQVPEPPRSLADTWLPRLRRLRSKAPLPLTVVAVVAALLFVFRPDDSTGKGFVDYAFLHVNERTGAPTRYDPCEPVRYVVNVDLAPPGAEEALEQAFAELSTATGMTFVNEGSTSEKVTLRLPDEEEDIFSLPERTADYSAAYQKRFNRPSYQPERYGERWAPVLISWSAFEELDVGYSGTILGVGASDPRDAGDRGTVTAYVSGVVVLNVSAAFRDLRTTIMHELGHVVGLQHVDSPGELMFPRSGNAQGWGPGDLEGLHRLGRLAGCVAVPPPP